MDFKSQITQAGSPVVLATRALTVAAPLTGGGDLSANRTLGLAIDTTLQVSNGQLGVSALVALASHSHTFASLTSKPTTLAGYGITDAQALDADLTTIAALTANGLLKKTAGVWGMDASAYLTGNQTITLDGDVSGSGATAITVTLDTTGVVAGTYRSLTVDAKGRVTAGTNPTTIAGYGITDAPTKTGTGASGSWSISITGDAATVGGIGIAAAGVAPGANKIVRSEANGYTYLYYINSSSPVNETPTISQVIVTNGTDTFYRKTSIVSLTAAVQANAGGSWNITAASATLATNASWAQLASQLGSGYYTADTWLRSQGDTNQVKLYGNSRTINFRTDGATNPVAAQGNYPFIFTYGGDAAGNRVMIIHTDGTLWTPAYGWLGTTFASLSGANFSGAITAPYMAVSGASSGYQFYDRTTSQIWVWYASGGYANLWYGGVSVMQTSTGGNVGVRVGVWGSCAMSIKSVGTTSATYGLIVYDSNQANTFYVQDNGVAWLKATLTQNSDVRLKHAIADIANPLGLITALRPRSFVMNDDPEERVRFGLIAQEALPTVPELLTLKQHPHEEEAHYTLDYIGLIAPLIGAVQALASRVIALEEAGACSQ